jgi:hypothetical protein
MLNQGFGQPALAAGGTAFPGGGKKAGGGFARDPGAMFDLMTGGKASLPIEKIFFGQDFAKQFVKDKGIANGQLTRVQYIEFSQAYSEF